MSKTTKIIAALGVVAGLGVAALPTFTFAEGEPSVNGEVDLYVEVTPAIAMTITGNNDDRTHYDDGKGTFVYNVKEVTVGTTSVVGLYERTGEPGSYVYTLTEDSVAVEGKTYYEKVATSYVDVFAPNEAASSVIDGHTTPAAQMLGPSSSWIAMLPNAVANGNDTNGFKSTINVYTNADSGYTLSVKDKDSTLALSKIGGGATIDALESDGNLTPGTDAWGYKVDTASPDGTGYKAIKATDATVKTKATKTTGGEETKVYYGVATASDQETGVYTDTLVYTATVNP